MKLRTGTAFVLMICLIVFSVGFGAYRGWSRERAEVEKAYDGLNELVSSSNSRLEDMLSRRVEAANSLLTVARRHLPDTDEAIRALTEDRDTLANQSSLAEKAEANRRFAQHAEALLALLAQQPSVQQNARDLAYVAQPGYLRTVLQNSEAQASEDQFTQAVQSFSDAVAQYNLAADDYNRELNGSFSGWVARLLGVKAIDRFSDATQISFSVSPALRIPPRPQGAVADMTLMSVLDEQTVTDLETLSQRLEQATGGRLYVLAVDFLNKASPEDYARATFEQWGLKSRDALLVMAVGDHSRVITGGSDALKVLDQITLDRLFGRYFDPLYQNLEYSRAAATLAQAAAQELAKPKTLDVSGLFGSFAEADLTEKEPEKEPGQSAQKPAEEGGASLTHILNTMLNNVQQLNESKASARRFNWRGVLIWGLVIYFIFFRKKSRKRR
ncbi:MAG: TPM domain-containing protein [Clostridia bacterium]|nr:TPM domain-containing protein [Clostridia bacterium]